MILYFTFRHPPKKLRDRDRERERKNVRSLGGNGCRTGGKSSYVSFFNLHYSEREREREKERKRAA